MQDLNRHFSALGGEFELVLDLGEAGGGGEAEEFVVIVHGFPLRAEGAAETFVYGLGSLKTGGAGYFNFQAAFGGHAPRGLAIAHVFGGINVDFACALQFGKHFLC